MGEEILKCVIEDIEYGKNLYEKLIDKIVHISDSSNVVVIFPDSDKELLKSAKKYFKRFVSEYNLVVVIKSIDIDFLSEEYNCFIKIFDIGNDDMDKLLRYVSVYGNSSIKIVSLNKPHTQKSYILLNYNDINMDLLVSRALYEIVGEIDEK